MIVATSDDELLHRFIAEDQEAFAILVTRYQGVVRAACSRQALPSERDDCVQAVFLVLARRPHAAVRAGNLPGWLVRVAWFVCRRAHRAAARRRRVEHAAAQLQSHTPDSADSEALFHLDDCLQRLPERQRTAVTLHYLSSRPVEEVATHLGVSRDHAYQLLSRGLAGLRVLLARRGVVLSAAALGTLLSGEGQAATAAVADSGATVLFATRNPIPSPATLTLAHGAMTAMTLATATPIALAAGLLLSLGLTTAALTAEQAPEVPPPPATSAPVAAGQKPDDAEWRNTVAQTLEQRVTFDFQDQDLSEVVKFLGQITGLTFVLHPKAIAATPPRITLRVEQMRLKDAIDLIMRLTDLSYSLVDRVILIIPRDALPKEAPGPHPTIDPAQRSSVPTMPTSGANG